ncbi:MAG: endonuclease/exonuclease/phosphatase family protein [Bacteroidetes bacterium]|nr:endonuclease/exonuclease/phosphatase family protein [Bacteroidota bacterium]
MKSLTFLLILLCAQSIRLFAQTINVATFNIRYDNPGDTGNLWVNRAPVVSSLIRFHDFDLFGVQEALKNQLDDIGTALPYLSRYGIGRNDGKDGGEHAAIFYKKDKFRLLKSGDFWLSQTPDKPGLGWDATCCNRICSWAYFEDKESGKKFFFFNVHFDHQGVIARKESAKLMIQKVKEIARGEAVILTGDLNGGRDSEWYQSLAKSGILKDSYHDVKYPYELNSSGNGFKAPKDKSVIDHIFTSKEFSARRWGILTDTYFGKFPSDHFPVMATLSF